jgi:uncharacterized protein
MVAPLADKMDDLRTLCRKHRVKSLWLFGSAVGEGFDAARSDVDAIVRFEEMDYRCRADHYYGLRDEMSQLLRRRVDLIEEDAITNPNFRAEVDRSRVLIHAA